ncbi:hypothetical protein E2C01_067767 [Portunus trituberculatus]|uniref:Uncharacterized protein n=1 Tax=Portunus trituberculatus TaxID=210409 RepID=A0A5B7HXM0_PORTR|nr:hypothetical protein [Portunus trituberculatus]
MKRNTTTTTTTTTTTIITTTTINNNTTNINMIGHKPYPCPQKQPLFLATVFPSTQGQGQPREAFCQHPFLVITEEAHLSMTKNRRRKMRRKKAEEGDKLEEEVEEKEK